MKKLQRTMDGNTLRLSDGDTLLLSMQEELQDTCVRITLAGTIPNSVVHDLQDELVALATVGKDVVVDVSGITYISSSGMHGFLQVQQRMDAMDRGSLTLQHVPPEILADFHSIGLDELLMIEG